MPEIGYTISPIFDEEVTDELIGRCRVDARARAERDGAMLTGAPPEVAEMMLPPLGLVRCVRFEMTR